MFVSADTIGLVKDCNLPPTKILKDLGAVPKRSKYGEKWVNNGIKGANEPRITIYPTWRRYNRIRVDLELSKLLHGHNVRLLNETEINDVLHLVSRNVENRTTIPFDAFNISMCRIDYAINIHFEPHIAREFLKRYFTYSIPRLLRHIIESQTVYFENNSRTISLYDKHLQMLKKKSVPPEVIKAAEGLIRIEYSLKDEKSVQRFAERLGFKDVLAKTLLSQQSIKTATDEVCELLNVESFEYSDDSRIKRIFDQTGDIKKAIQLSGFLDAIKEFREDFYLSDGMNFSKSTYDRLKKESQELGF